MDRIIVKTVENTSSDVWPTEIFMVKLLVVFFVGVLLADGRVNCPIDYLL